MYHEWELVLSTDPLYYTKNEIHLVSGDNDEADNNLQEAATIKGSMQLGGLLGRHTYTTLSKVLSKLIFVTYQIL